MGGAAKNVSKGATNFKGASPTLKALGRAQTSVLKNREATAKKIGEKNPLKKKGGKKSSSKENKRIKDIRDSQKKTQKEIRGLFKDLKKPKQTQREIKRLLAKVKRIDTSKLTDKAAFDVDRLRQIATTKGPTEGAKALLEEQKLGEKSLLEDIQSGQAEAGQGAFESLASRGGAGAGSRERLLAQTGRQGLIEQQRARRAGAQSRLGIRSEDEGRKLGIAGQLPGQQLGVAGASLAAQQAQTQSQFQEAAQLAQAKQFDVSAAQQAQQFRTGGLAGQLQQGQKQAQEFESAQILAKAQRDLANKKQPGPLEQFDPTGVVSAFQGANPLTRGQ